MQLLVPGKGAALLAAKSLYFGVGGSTAGFRKLVRQRSELCIDVVAVLDDGASTKREIMLLYFQGSRPAWCIDWHPKGPNP